MKACSETVPVEQNNTEASRMMRNLAKFSAISLSLLALEMQPSAAQPQLQGQQTQQGQQAQQGQPPQAAAANPTGAPFVLQPQEQAALDQVLLAWQQQSQGTKRLESKFRRWHYDLIAAPAGVHSSWSEGVLKYGAPDKGLFRVDTLKFFTGIVEAKATYAETPGQFGEHWVCNGQALLEFDRTKKECRIQQLPPELQGKEIFESPLPFVFNLDAAKIKQRYWLKQLEAPAGMVVIEAHPKLQSDRAQYKFVRIIINAQNFLPQALILFGPNFDPETAPSYDHYEFLDVQRNSIASGIANWADLWIKETPPSDWKVINDSYRPNAPLQATQPNDGSAIR